MSRAKATDVSSPISLFPFIGVLLSTMGALLVVLIVASRSAHDAAVRELETKRNAAAASGQANDRESLQQVNDYVAKLNGVRTEAEKRLRDDQLRLSHIEDHTRRLKTQLDALQNSVNELVSLDGEHYDDRKQAEREIERLGQLIASTREAIASLQDENKTKKRSFSIIPYDGPNGTSRRPIYIECRKNEVVLQPEGIHLTAEDFRPPLGAGNPLAAALRAASEFIIRQEGGTSSSRETQPYPLILVRPEGILAYYRVRQAIESWDAEFGYELIDNDWKLEYPASNPLLAELEHQAVQFSRTRQQMLVAAAPRAYGGRHQMGGNSFDEDDDVEEGDGSGEFSDERGGGFGAGSRGGGARYGDGSGGPYAADTHANGERGEFIGDGLPNGGGGESTSGPGGEVTDGLVGAPGNSSNGSGVGANGAGGGASTNGGAVVPQSSGQQTNSLDIVAGTPLGDGAKANSRGAPPPLSPSATGASLASGVGEANLAAVDRSVGNATGARAPSAGARMSSDEPPERVPLDMQMNVQQKIPASSRGQNWAVKGKGPTSVPIRRPIRVVVRADRLAIQPDSQQSTPKAVSGKEIPLPGSTAANLDDFVRAVQSRVQDWGLAGSGMYWRPVLLLDVGPDGQARADDLARLLRNSGIEVRTDATATRPQEGVPSATR
ncbi:MAG: hypothetical protein WD468_11875 [Pirellulales bacterium]